MKRVLLGIRSHQVVALLGIGLLILSGCAGNARAPQNIEEGLFAAANYGLAMTRSVNESKHTGMITAEQHEGALVMLQQAHDTVEAGFVAYRLGDFTEAESKLEAADMVLQTLALLVQRFGDPA